jgi:DNA-binding response OmpR family regulator
MHKVLIVDDDEVTSQHLKFSLTKQGYEVVAMAGDTLQARNKMTIYQPDVILLDISLDEESDGISLASFINKEVGIPFIYISSHSEDHYIKKAQATKPYGYLVKPFDPNSLHTTIQMALAKYESDKEQSETTQSISKENQRLEKLFAHAKDGENEIQAFGEGYQFDHKHLELSFKGEKIKLTKREKAALQMLLSQIGHTLSFDQMIAYIWSDKSASFNNLRTLIWRLRAKLPTDLIENRSGQGYMVRA